MLRLQEAAAIMFVGNSLHLWDNYIKSLWAILRLQVLHLPTVPHLECCSKENTNQYESSQHTSLW